MDKENLIKVYLATENKPGHYDLTMPDCEIKDLVNKFDNDNIVSKIKEDDSGINVYIGNENNIDDDLTVIKTKYNVNGREGTLAILGPKRMEYDRVVSLLEYLKEEIEK